MVLVWAASSKSSSLSLPLLPVSFWLIDSNSCKRAAHCLFLFWPPPPPAKMTASASNVGQTASASAATASDLVIFSNIVLSHVDKQSKAKQSKANLQNKAKQSKEAGWAQKAGKHVQWQPRSKVFWQMHIIDIEIIVSNISITDTKRPRHKY